MAVCLKLNELNDNQRKIIRKFLFMQPKKLQPFKTNFYSSEKDPILFYHIDKPNGKIYLPYTFANSLMKTHINSKLNYPSRNWSFINTTLRDYQIPIVEKAMIHLNDKGTTTLGCPPGHGKTLMSIYMASKLNGLCLIIVPLKLVQKGWETSFKQYTNAKVFNGKSKDEKLIENDVIITMDTMVHKIPQNVLKNVKTLIIDEVHMFCTPKRVHCFLSTTPKYVIACSATPKRADGMETMIHAVCGTHGIFIKPKKVYTVYKLMTGIKTEIKKTSKGGTDWPQLVKDLAFDKTRNQIIIDIVKNNLNHKIMIMTWSKDHAKFLSTIFNDIGISSDYLMGNKTSYSDSQVLVASLSKSGTGFDEAVVSKNWDKTRLNMLLLVGSTKNTEALYQFVGRIFRSDHPIIYDFVDDNRISKNHWYKRRKWYLDPEQNGKIIEIQYKNE